MVNFISSFSSMYVFSFFLTSMTNQTKFYYEDYIRRTVEGHLIVAKKLGLEKIDQNLKQMNFFQSAIKELGYSYEVDIYPYLRNEFEKSVATL